MTSAERDRAVSYLQQTRAALVESTRGLDAAQWRHKPSDDAWSAAECIEHLSLSEEHLLGVLQGMAAEAAAAEGQLAAAAGKEKLIEKAVPSRGKKVKGPAEMHPRIE